jgi:hypothetical protein
MPNLYLYDVHGKLFAKHGMFWPVQQSASWQSGLI